MRSIFLLLASVLTTLALSSGVALAEIKVGTDNPETLTGTNSADHITGKGGNDTLKGLAANDVYHFDDGFGQDTLEELATYKVGKKKKPGGTDTLSFSGVATDVDVYLIPQWSNQGYNNAYTYGSDGFLRMVDLRTSPVENATGGSDHDSLHGGSARNTLKGGPGGNDILTDLGGDDGSAAGIGGLPDLPASSDTYKGFTSGTGNDRVLDYGGTADKLDLRPLESSDVYFDAFDFDNSGANDSLRLVINATNQVEVVGHFAPVAGETDDGRMEQIVFSDETVTSAAELDSLM